MTRTVAAVTAAHGTQIHQALVAARRVDITSIIGATDRGSEGVANSSDSHPDIAGALALGGQSAPGSHVGARRVARLGGRGSGRQAPATGCPPTGGSVGSADGEPAAPSLADSPMS
ncbi:hypothetical protein [Blastococcus sp. KM273129]|uniref:hypothetical protein n=1 Tax=Blastococcus sp. KM273129 TaxID=2570315 RepID=UPI001F1BF054|nr:hypothetical protein [Blastococcus sp. KM273129]